MVRCELEKQLKFLSQNVRGLNHDKEEELVDFMCTNNIFACGIQETWRLGSDITENNGFVVVQLVVNRNVEGKEELPAALL